MYIFFEKLYIIKIYCSIIALAHLTIIIIIKLYYNNNNNYYYYYGRVFIKKKKKIIFRGGLKWLFRAKNNGLTLAESF